MFDPKTDRFPYPEDTDKHYLTLKKDRGIVFDSSYPYVDKSRSFRFKYTVMRVMMYLVMFPLARIRLGLRFKGRENLKKHRETIKKGVVSCSNHVHMWDYISLMSAVRPFRTHVLSWAPNINGENGTLIRLTGGIPIPTEGIGATVAYLRAVGKMLDEGGWAHVYSEGSMWEYYAPIRPFKRGGAAIACDFDKPMLPIAFSFREPGFIRKKLFRQIACLNVSIGEPIFRDPSLPKAEQRTELTKRCHEAVCRLAGIDPKENIYPPLFDDSKRIDYYTSTYGVGYKGSK